jgi:hypothetical protein
MWQRWRCQSLWLSVALLCRAALGAGGIEVFDHTMLLRIAAVKRHSLFCRNTIFLPSMSMQKQWFATGCRTEGDCFAGPGHTEHGTAARGAEKSLIHQF